MAVAGGWTDPTEQSLGATYTYKRSMHGVDYTVTCQTNDKRITYISIMANATYNDKKTKSTTASKVKNFMKNIILPAINDNVGTGTEVF